ncbi:hypothetical protein OG271_30345 [Micromonospora rifamycinica]|uniref:hypothetical protein n=1 Tax=Micromonospora rifamycinica TaxID=291594 RepID=UPI002E2DC9C7|nr:hypothetical protein [Micromonospora rifamycinica]
MHAAELLPWPRFVLRSVTCPAGVSALALQALGMNGVPVRGVGGEYAALPEAVFLDDHTSLLAFGQSGLDGSICIDSDSLEIVHVPELDRSGVNLVNSNLAAFSACVKIVISRFPYYSYETAEENGDEVASFLRGKLLEIDDFVGVHNGLWGTFLDDVAMGNYAIEEFDRMVVE